MKFLLVLSLLLASSASADDAFSISAISNNDTLTYCMGIRTADISIAPAHCFKGNTKLYIHSTANPIIAERIFKTQPITPFDLAIIEKAIPRPPNGELVQRGLSCRTHPLKDHIYAHNCAHLKKGDSGSLIHGDDINLMHLGIIKIDGNTLGFGLDYSATIKDINVFDNGVRHLIEVKN